MFFLRWLLAGLWGSILADFDRFWGALGMPFGSKMGSENEVRKKSEKGWFKYVRKLGSGSLKQLESSIKQQADGSWQPAASRMAIGMGMAMEMGMGMGMHEWPKVTERP